MISLAPIQGSAGSIDVSGLRAVFGRFPSGVVALCALDPDGIPIGMAASAFVGVSMEPPLVGLFIQATSTTWPRLHARPAIGLSILGAGQHAACRQLAAREGDRFAELSWHATDDGAVLLHDAAAWLDCVVESTVAAGDHELVLLQVRRQGTRHEVSPLVFHDSSFHGLAALDHPS